MTIEQLQELSDLTGQAVANNDTKSLVEIYKILKAELANDPGEFGSFGTEWFFSSMTSDQKQAILISDQND